MTDGLCECGCGNKTGIATITRRGYIKGTSIRWIVGHNVGAKVIHTSARISHKFEYHAWKNAKQRCTNPNSQRYKCYGARGIRFKFDSFTQFFNHIGPKPSPKHVLDRINNDGHYEIGNIKWSTFEESMANKRHLGGYTK